MSAREYERKAMWVSVRCTPSMSSAGARSRNGAWFITNRGNSSGFWKEVRLRTDGPTYQVIGVVAQNTTLYGPASLLAALEQKKIQKGDPNGPGH